MEMKVACVTYSNEIHDYNRIAKCISDTHNIHPNIKFYVTSECNIQKESALTIKEISDIFARTALEVEGYIVIGFLEVSENIYFSSFATFSPRGKLVAHTRGLTREPPSHKLSEDVVKKFQDQSLPEWVSTMNKTEAFETEYGRVGVCCGGLELFRNGPLISSVSITKLNFWVGGARFLGHRTLNKIRAEIENEIEIITNDKFDNCALIAASYLPSVDGGKAINVIWDFTKKNTTMIDVAKVVDGFHVSVGTVSYDDPSFVLPPTLSPEYLSQPPIAGKVRMAGAQMSSDLENNEKNAEKMFKMIREAATNHAKFIVFPEAALTGYLSQSLLVNWQLPGRKNAFPQGVHPGPHAIQVVDNPDELLLKFTELSKELDIYIVVPFVEKANFGDQEIGGTEFDSIVARKDSEREKKIYTNDDVLFYNTALLISPSIIDPGKAEPFCRWSHYRKRMPWPHPEISWAEAGQLAPAVTTTPYGKVGLAICFDIHTILDHYKGHNLWTLLYPIAWVDANPLPLWFHTGLPDFVHKEYRGLNVVGVNWSVDKYEKWLGYGYSYMLENHKIISCTESFYGDELLFADFDYSPSYA